MILLLRKSFWYQSNCSALGTSAQQKTFLVLSAPHYFQRDTPWASFIFHMLKIIWKGIQFIFTAAQDCFQMLIYELHFLAGHKHISKNDRDRFIHSKNISSITRELLLVCFMLALISRDTQNASTSFQEQSFTIFWFLPYLMKIIYQSIVWKNISSSDSIKHLFSP